MATSPAQQELGVLAAIWRKGRSKLFKQVLFICECHAHQLPVYRQQHLCSMLERLQQTEKMEEV